MGGEKVSLFEIASVPTARNSVIQLNPADNVAIARVPLQPGQTVQIGETEIAVTQPIPVGHKISLSPIAEGAHVFRYGHPIGRARTLIGSGEHIHTHNLACEEHPLDYEFPGVDLPLPAPLANAPAFRGYARVDGRAGTRNYIAVVAASNCAAHVATLIGQSYGRESLPENVDGVVAFPHGEGCAHTIGPDTEQLRRTLAGVLDHPNVSAAVILGLGCETNQIEHYLGPDAQATERLIGLTIQGNGGTRATVEAARKQIDRLVERAAAERRQEVSAAKIVLGLNCGGSDSFSGVTANPALGVCSDMLSEIGATAVLAETTETFGAEHLLIARARNRGVAERYLSFVRGYKDYLRRMGGSFDDNPSPGNKAGGLTNIVEKSLGAVAKAGSTTMNETVDYAERVHGHGFVFMNTPGYDPVSLTGLAAGGVNLIAFTTGRGSAIGFPSIPVIKIATNSATWRRMRDNMDINAGRIADGDATVAEIGREIFDTVLRVASGERTCSERLGHSEFVPWRIGPVL
jgi:altronate hydrolase